MKFLVLRFSSIGDIVLTTPVVRCLKKAFPDAEIHYATKKGFHSILKHNPHISKIHLLEDSVLKLAKQLSNEHFDHIIDLHNNQRTLVLKFLLESNSTAFNKLNLEKWLMVNFKINLLPHEHIVDRYLDTCKALGVENDGEGLDYFLGAEDEVNPGSLPPALQGGYIAWVIGAKQNTKKFPVEKISRVLQQVNSPVMLLGGPEDREEGEFIIASLPPPKAIYNAAGRYTINQSAGLVKQAKLVVTNDTGLAHIASAFKRPVILTWGNTIPEFGMYPYKTRHIPFEVNGLDCRPCSKLGYNSCPKGHFKCMKDIDELALAASINRLLL